jgi:CRISPR-associated protein Csm1
MEKQKLTTDPIRERIYLAALLHDIGKFYQRADENLFLNEKKNSQAEIGDVSFALAQSICPAKENGRFGYHHVVWTSEFFERKSKLFKVLTQLAVNPNEILAFQ